MDNLNFENFIREKRLAYQKLGSTPDFPPRREAVPDTEPRVDAEPVTDAYAKEEAEKDVNRASTDVFSQAVLMPEGSNEDDVKDVFRLPDISQEELDKLPASEKMKLTLVDIFSIKKEKKEKLSKEENRRNEQIETAVNNMKEDRLEIMHKALKDVGETKREEMISFLKRNAEIVSHLSSKGFDKCMELFSADSMQARFAIVNSPELSRSDKDKIKRILKMKGSKKVGSLLEDVDKKVGEKRAKEKAAAKLVEEKEANAKKKAEAEDTSEESIVVENKEEVVEDRLALEAEFLETKVSKYIEDLNSATKKQLELDKNRKTEETEKYASIGNEKAEIDKALRGKPLNEADKVRANLLGENKGLLDSIGSDLQEAEKNINTLKKQTGDAKNSIAKKVDELDKLSKWDVAARLYLEKQIKEENEALGKNNNRLARATETQKNLQENKQKQELIVSYLEEIDLNSNNVVIDKLNKITKDFLDGLDLKYNEIGEFTIEMKESEGELLPAIVASDEQGKDVYFKKLFGDEKVIFINEEMVAKVKRRVEEMKAERAKAV